MSNQPNTN